MQKKIFAEILCENPILQALFQKRKGSGAGSGSIPVIDGSGSWMPTTFGSGYPALILIYPIYHV
jgi:hypothetical protein